MTQRLRSIAVTVSSHAATDAGYDAIHAAAILTTK